MSWAVSVAAKASASWRGERSSPRAAMEEAASAPAPSTANTYLRSISHSPTQNDRPERSRARPGLKKAATLPATKAGFRGERCRFFERSEEHTSELQSRQYL